MMKVYLHKEGMRMVKKIDMKRTGKGEYRLILFIIVIGVAGILLLTPWQHAVMAQDELAARPVAVITGTLLVYVGHTVYLDGTESYDPGGGPVDYQWKLVYTPQGSDAVMTDETDSEASFTCDKVGVYQVQLIVNNGFSNSKPVDATISCIDRPYFW
jgi:hypothetical protein